MVAKISLREAILELLKQKDKPISLQNIYFEIDKYYLVTSYEKELDEKYPSPRIEHEIRSIITRLVKEKRVTRQKRGFYQILN